MDDLIFLHSKLVPEVVEMTEKRYSIMKAIEFNQPVGRRTLANLLQKSERWVRSELDVLKSQNLIDIDPLGMTITAEGLQVLTGLRDYIIEIKGLKNLSDGLREKLGVREVIIIPGDSSEQSQILTDMSKTAFDYLKKCLKNNSVIAVSGGYSVMSVAENAENLNLKDLVVVPARGGIKADMERQANLVAAKLGKNIGGQYYLLHLPDVVNEEVFDRLLDDPDIKTVIDYIKNADFFIFGTSSLEAIAMKRNINRDELDFLKSVHARAEAYGYYFDSVGKVVHRNGTVGIKETDLKGIGTVMSIGGGALRAEAMIIVNKNRENHVLVVDEAAAKEMYRLLK